MRPIEFIATNNLPWWLANVIKYTMRYDTKDGLKDLYIPAPVTDELWPATSMQNDSGLPQGLAHHSAAG